jgi:hypothetical protein
MAERGSAPAGVSTSVPGLTDWFSPMLKDLLSQISHHAEVYLGNCRKGRA